MLTIIFSILFLVSFIGLCKMSFYLFKDFRFFIKEGYIILWFTSLIATLMSGIATYNFLIS